MKQRSESRDVDPGIEDWHGEDDRRRVLAVFDATRAGRRALRRAVALAVDADLFVVTLAPQVCARGAGSPAASAYNIGVRAQAREDAELARAALAESFDGRTSVTTLVGRCEHLLPAWTFELEVAVVVLPGRGPLRRAGRLGRTLRRAGVRASIVAA